MKHPTTRENRRWFHFTPLARWVITRGWQSRKPLLWSTLLAIGLEVALGDSESPLRVRLDGQRHGRIFEGVGALSAGASSRLLMEYPEPFRSDVLDLLFKPNYGAGFQHLKVEIGGDVNSTDGCEPSHQHSRDDANYQRGYEWWLMKEARRRNPQILLDCLEWGAPAWIGQGEFFSQDNADYICRFIKGAKSVHGLDLNYVGIWNETRPNLGWIKRLRRTLDRQGLSSVGIVAVDDINRWNLVDVLEGDPELARAVQVVGVHYPQYRSTEAARHGQKPIWSSEDGPWKGNWAGAEALAKQFNRNYVLGRMTKTIIWSPVTSYYDNLPLPGSGVMKANTPWSGAFDVQPALWAVAHTAQFAKPGWIYLEDGGCALLPGGGSYVTLKAGNGFDYSIIVETIGATNRQDVVFELTGGLSTNPVHVWRSDRDAQFQPQTDLCVLENRVVTSFDPGCIYSLTTTSGQRKGSPRSPERGPFPLPYTEDFELYATGAVPWYFSDQAGIFLVTRRRGGGKALRQIIEQKGIEWPFHLNPYPETFLGDANWMDYEVRTDVLIERAGFVSLFGRVGTIPQSASPPNGYWLKIDHLGEWEVGTAKAALAAGHVAFSANTWHRLTFRFASTNIRAFIDDQLVANLSDDSYPCGMVGVGSGWHRAQFDNLRVQATGSERNLAFARPALSSSSAGVDYRAGHVTDGDAFTSRWMAAEGKTAGEWIEVDLGTARSVNTVTIKAFDDRIRRFKIQVSTGSDWTDASSGTELGASQRTITFPSVTTARVRLVIDEATRSPSIWEMEVRNRD